MKRQFKRVIACVIAMILVLGCVGCAATQPEHQEEPQTPPAVTPDSPGTTEEGAEAETPEQEQNPEPEPEQPEPDYMAGPKLSSNELTLLSMPQMELATVDAGRLTAADYEMLQLPAKAKPVIFIADGGVGDGSSPDSPLSLEVSNNVVPDGENFTNFYDSLLYQATAKLYGTGGTIVLVGEVLCDGSDGLGQNDQRELRLPHLGGAGVTVTSVWNGVDYRETSNARLILQSPVTLALNNPFTFRDMDICTQASEGYAATNRMICAGGFPLVMDTGLRCIPLDEQGNAYTDPTIDMYPVIVGGHSFSTLEGSTDVTLRSGTYYNVVGGCMGIGVSSYGDQNGTSKVTIDGTAQIFGTLTAASPDGRALQDGDATIVIKGGEIYNKVQFCGNGGFAGPNCTATLTITGGTFSDGVKFMAKSSSNYGSKPRTTVLDYSAYTGSSDILSKAVGFAQIAGKSEDIDAAAMASAPDRITYFTGDLIDLTGLSLSVTYGDKEKMLNYSNSISAFAFETADGTVIDPETFRVTEDVTQIKVFYGGNAVGEYEITVLPRPAIAIVGTGVRKDSERQELGFFFGVETGNFPDIAIKTCGILTLPASWLQTPADLTRRSIAGQRDLQCSEIPADITSTCADFSGLYYASVKNIPVEEYNEAYAAVAYYTFVHDDKVYTAYSQPCTASVYTVAKQTGGAPNVVMLTESGGTSTKDEAMVNEKIEEMFAYFESMATLAWTAPEEINFSGSSSVTDAVKYEAGKEYYGLPYIGGYNGMDNLENFLGQLDENGVYVGPTAWNTMHGNNCSSAVFQSMGRFTNNYDYWSRANDPILNVIPKMDNADAPYIAVGPYQIKHTSALTKQIMKDNGDMQIIYESYAAAKRGDYLFSHWSAGIDLLCHTRLISGVHVERDFDGNILPLESYLLIHEQTATVDQKTATSWGLDRKINFDRLASEGYLPSRDVSFETGYFETPHCAVYDANHAANISQGVRGRVVSNYDLSEVEIEIVNTDTGETAFLAKDYCYINRSCSLTSMDPKNEVGKLVGTGNFEYILRVSTANETRELLRFAF